MAKQKDLTGYRFGRWRVIKKDSDIIRKDYKEAVWVCQCDCGSMGLVRSRMLLHNTSNSRSCGCARADKQRENPSRLKHGLSHKHPLYKIWKTMRQRCNNPNNKKYHRYGGRGIRVCERWDEFTNFLEDMGSSWKDELTLDRRNNNGNYEPSNCRWALPIVQANNKESVSRHLVVIESQGFSESDWLTWETNDDMVKFIDKFLSSTANKPNYIRLYRWIDESCVVLEFKWESGHEAIS